MKSTLFFALSVTAAIFINATPSHAQKLSAAEVSNKFIGQNFKWRSQGNRVGSITYYQNGSIAWRNGSGNSGKGEWRFDGDKLCNKFAPAGNWKGRKWRCGNVSERKGKFKFLKSTHWN